MRVVLDSNVLFSALIKDSLTRRLILQYDGLFLFPSFIFEEMERHKGLLLRKSGMKKVEFDRLLEFLLRKVVIVPSEVLYPYRKKALDLVKDIDSDDVLFVACALAYLDSVIWSDDKKLKQQSRVKVLNTSEIMNIL